MKIQLNGINLFFDVEGASLRANGDAMREDPTVILLHGGPGADHSIYKPYFTALSKRPVCTVLTAWRDIS